jgi:hypothetical protein
MKQILFWGGVFGFCAFIANILLPGCIEPFADMLAAFFAAVLVVRQNHPESRRAGMRSGIMTGLIVGIIITITDLITASLLAAGFLYRDQLPWINLPDISYLNSIFGNTLLVFLSIFLCLGVIKIIMALMGGAVGGTIFTPSSPDNTKPNELGIISTNG